MIILILLLILVPLMAAHELCDNRISEDKLEITQITDPEQTNGATWSWGQTDDIKISVDVENKNLTQRDFQLELFLLDEDLQEVNFTSTNTNPKQTTSIDEGGQETLNLSFKLKELTHPFYYLYAKLTDKNNESICTSLKATSTAEESIIGIKEEEKIIIVRKIKGPTNTTPGSKIEYIVEIINFGASTEGTVSAIMYNSHLKIREKREITNLEAGKSKTVTFNLTIPENASLTQESFFFSTEYDYDEEKGIYYQSSDKTKTFYTQIIQNQSTQITQTQENTAQIENQTKNQTVLIAQEEETETEKIPYLWPIIITFIIAIMIAISTSLFLKYKKNQYLNDTPSAPTPANTYVAEIQEKIKSSQTP